MCLEEHNNALIDALMDALIDALINALSRHAEKLSGIQLLLSLLLQLLFSLNCESKATVAGYKTLNKVAVKSLEIYQRTSLNVNVTMGPYLETL